MSGEGNSAGEFWDLWVIDTVVFDFGGVLMKTADPAGRREWEARLGLRPGQLEQTVHGSEMWNNAQCGRITPEAYWAWVASTLNVPKADLPQLQHDYFHDDHLDMALMDLIATLRRGGHRVGLLSNDALTLEHKLRQELDIYDAFDRVVISAQIGVMKPDRAAYEAIAAALQVPLDTCVFIDDNAANIEGARRAGMATIHYRAGMDLYGALRPILLPSHSSKTTQL